MNKKQIIIMTGLGFVFFALFFTVGLFMNNPEPAAADPGETRAENADRQTGDDLEINIDSVAESKHHMSQAGLDRQLSEQQLRDLIFEVRSKLTELRSREKEVVQQEQRVQVTMEELQQNVQDLEELRLQLASTSASIKQQQKNLEQTLIRIDEVDKKNIQKTAMIYDKMKTAGASEIILNLSKSNQLDYAVKIIYYMSERTSASVLAKIAEKEPALAAIISDRLRRTDEVEK